MRKELLELIQSREDLREFIREQPQWYRKLSRNPSDIEAFELASMHYYKTTIPDRVEKFQNQLQMAALMIEMFQYMKQSTNAPQAEDVEGANEGDLSQEQAVTHSDPDATPEL